MTKDDELKPAAGWFGKKSSTYRKPSSLKSNDALKKYLHSMFNSIKTNMAGFVIRYKLLSTVLFILALLSLFTSVPIFPRINMNSGKYVIILAANEGGGVLQWKGAREWSTERSSIANKKHYASQHGYHLAIKDVSSKKRYTHEWRESWEKADIIRQTMRQFPKAEWFWWLDLHTIIMEPQISLNTLIFDNLYNVTERDVASFNPLGLEVEIPFVNYQEPIDMIITQDCGGFNLGSFFIRRSEWSERLLDIWWDPVFYEQMHNIWEHKEQDALEYLYSVEPWIRSRMAFLPLRAINAFPPGACWDQADDPRYFYSEKSRDFLVNLAGCAWGRDCWEEMENYKTISQRLHRKKFFFF
ncbi:hypothetical protein NADFUDRAFT_46484 [Nadsonia fulvescens var. elongata DSM 6958]|uniref:Uncharacterized protein n=1 Tax=Nadsonia fulvescens var. elongata DSM 6958 TaxID=857566 RepID=A0A1E3PLR5_9ASCO|nr:hypothetical protein NADFUDRAFT_46484 [Nadsonia fulvescens var. elongata DSM 6958]